MIVFEGDIPEKEALNDTPKEFDEDEVVSYIFYEFCFENSVFLLFSRNVYF